MIKIIWAGSTSACFELENENPYLAPSPYTVLLDGEERLRGETNVFSLYGLSPDTAYTLTLRSEAGEESLPFRTGGETCALDVKALGAAGDGVTDDTAAIQRAVLVLPEGGRLFFPAGVYGGLKALKALSAPFVGLKFIPTGGVSADNLAEFLAAPFIYAVGGSWVCASADIKAGNFSKITELSKQARDIYHSVRG